jgi:uncharacterized surface protein with fasciclin (FAS1) repeats
MRSNRVALVFPLVFAIAACADEAPITTGPSALVPEAREDARGAVTPRAAASSPTIVDVALSVNAATGEFSTLIAAVLRAGIATELSARGQRTVFAPTDAAFAKLGLDEATIETVPVGALTEILLYHVAPGRREAASVVTADRIRMANGGFTRIRLEGGAAYINESQIIGTDVAASNGIIHVIDTVLIP